MNILVVGLGSMGKRRIRLLKQLYSQDISITGVEQNNERLLSVIKEFEIDGKTSLEDALKETFDCAFVCTPPLSHAKVIDRLLEKNLFIFTELNLVKAGYEKFIQPNVLKKIFLSSTLQYRKDINYIKNRVNNQNVNYIYHSGQYLPDWHPWESFKDYFVNEQKTNGCREILAIDLPWIISTFGKIKSMYVQSGKSSDLDISYNDNYQILAEHENGTKGCICIDILSRIATRKLEVYSENIHLFWNGTPESLQEYDLQCKKMIQIESYNSITQDSNYCENIIENAYMDEIIAFMDIVKKNDYSKMKYDLADDVYTLDLIDRIENN